MKSVGELSRIRGVAKVKSPMCPWKICRGQKTMPRHVDAENEQPNSCRHTDDIATTLMFCKLGIDMFFGLVVW